jgi:hypothetical protein
MREEKQEENKGKEMRGEVKGEDEEKIEKGDK